MNWVLKWRSSKSEANINTLIQDWVLATMNNGWNNRSAWAAFMTFIYSSVSLFLYLQYNMDGWISGWWQRLWLCQVRGKLRGVVFIPVGCFASLLRNSQNPNQKWKWCNLMTICRSICQKLYKGEKNIFFLRLGIALQAAVLAIFIFT